MTIYAEVKETVLADIPRVIPCSSRVSHYDRLAAVPGDGGFRCQDDDAGLGSAGGGWEEPVSIVVPMFTRQPEGPPIAIMFVMPRSWRAPPAKVMVTKADVGSSGLGVKAAAASPAPAFAEWMRSALVIRTGGMSAATAMSPAVSRWARARWAFCHHDGYGPITGKRSQSLVRWNG